MEKLTPKEILDTIGEIIINETPAMKIKRLIMESKLAQISRAQKKFAKNYTQIGVVETGKMRTDPETRERKQIVVPVFQFTGWNNTRYTGEKLRQIRQEQLAKALEENDKNGHTTYADGTPIVRDRLIDLKAV